MTSLSHSASNNIAIDTIGDSVVPLEKPTTFDRDMLKNLLLTLASILFSLLAAEWVLGRLALGPTYVAAKSSGIPYDTRTKLEVIRDHRNEDPNWFPAVTALTYVAHPLMLESKRLLPLGGVANANVVACNEAGFYATFATDGAGFHNPPGTWPVRGTSNIFLVGDSFTFGDCVKAGDDLASQLRKHFPSVINLASRGNGPLQELGTIREYIAPNTASYVFWLFYERNDLIELNRGRDDPILSRYIENDFSQALWSRQKRVNAAVRQYTEELVQEEIQKQANKGYEMFTHLRDAIGRGVARILPAKSNANPSQSKAALRRGPDFPLFKKVIAQAQREVEEKGGRFVFVYLPSYRRFSGEPLNPWADHKETVLELLEGLGTNIIDLEPHFHQQQDPLSLFPLRLNGHYNAQGYALLGDVLSDYLQTHAIQTVR